jgi:hypothetical protein
MLTCLYCHTNLPTMSYCFAYFVISTCLYMLSSHVNLHVYLLVYILFLTMVNCLGVVQNKTLHSYIPISHKWAWVKVHHSFILGTLIAFFIIVWSFSNYFTYYVPIVDGQIQVHSSMQNWAPRLFSHKPVPNGNIVLKVVKTWQANHFGLNLDTV